MRRGKSHAPYNLVDHAHHQRPQAISHYIGISLEEGRMDGIPPGLLLEENVGSSLSLEDAEGRDFRASVIPFGQGSSPKEDPMNMDMDIDNATMTMTMTNILGQILSTAVPPPVNYFTKYAGKYDYIMRYPDFSQNEVVRGVFIAFFIVESLIGVLGNFFVCLTVYRNKSMHSPVNYYIVNLGICDFLVGALVLPVKLFELTADAELNTMTDFWCTTVRFMETIVVFASVFTLVAICFERYNAVVYPVQSRVNMTNLRIRKVIVLVWLVPALVASPNLYPADAVSHFLFSRHGAFSRVTCFDGFSDSFRFGYFMFLFVFMYVIPLVLIFGTCFSIAKALLSEIPTQPRRNHRALSLEQGRRKVAKMVLVVVFSFLLCWSPYFIVTAVTQLTENFLAKEQYFFTMLLINLLAFTNSCINPFVYFAMSARFRKGFLCILGTLRICSRRTRFSPESSLSSMRRTSNNRTFQGIISLRVDDHQNGAAGGGGRRGHGQSRSTLFLSSSKGHGHGHSHSHGQGQGHGRRTHAHAHGQPRSLPNMSGISGPRSPRELIPPNIPLTQQGSTIKLRPQKHDHDHEHEHDVSTTVLVIDHVLTHSKASDQDLNKGHGQGHTNGTLPNGHHHQDLENSKETAVTGRASCYIHSEWKESCNL